MKILIDLFKIIPAVIIALFTIESVIDPLLHVLVVIVFGLILVMQCCLILFEGRSDFPTGIPMFILQYFFLIIGIAAYFSNKNESLERNIFVRNGELVNTDEENSLFKLNKKGDFEMYPIPTQDHYWFFRVKREFVLRGIWIRKNIEWKCWVTDRVKYFEELQKYSFDEKKLKTHIFNEMFPEIVFCGDMTGKIEEILEKCHPRSPYDWLEVDFTIY